MCFDIIFTLCSSSLDIIEQNVKNLATEVDSIFCDSGMRSQSECMEVL